MLALLPVLAEVADKLPTTAEMWTQAVTLGVVAAALVGGLSMVRLRWGGFAMGAVMICSALVAGDHSMDPDIQRELGSEYLVQRRCAPMLPATLVALSWLCVRVNSRNDLRLVVRAGSTSA